MAEPEKPAPALSVKAPAAPEGRWMRQAARKLGDAKALVVAAVGLIGVGAAGVRMVNKAVQPLLDRLDADEKTIAADHDHLQSDDEQLHQQHEDLLTYATARRSDRVAK